MKRQAILASAVLTTAIAAVVFLFDPVRSSFYPVCIFHRLTGLDCPICGATRALHALLHGELREAFAFNPLFVLSLPLTGLAVAFREKWLPLKPLWICIVVTTLMAFWIVRNTSAYHTMLPPP